MNRKKIGWCFVYLIVSTVVLGVFAYRTSPIYSLLMGDYTGNAVATAMLTAKYWLQGMIPYRDLFVMENPLYLFIQLMGWFIAERTGIFLLEVLNFTIFLIFLEKMLTLFVTEKKARILSLLSLIPYIAFCSGGDSKAEWCLSLLTIGLYLLLQAVQNNIYIDASKGESVLQTYPSGQGKETVLNFWILGLLSGIILMIHPISGSLLYGGVLVLLVVSAIQKGKRTLLKNIVFGGIGLAIPILIIVIYFWTVEGLSDWYHAVIVYPIKAMCSDLLNLRVLLHKAVKCCLLLPLFFVGVYLMVSIHTSLGTSVILSEEEVSLQIQERRGKVLGIYLIGMSVLAAVLQMLNNNSWYCFVAMIPAIMLAIAVSLTVLEEKKIMQVILIGVEGVLVFAICAIPIKNYLYYLKDGVQEVLYEFCEDVNEYRSQFDDCKILAIDTDCSFFLYLNQNPMVKYFTAQTELSEYDSDIEAEIDSYKNAFDIDLLLTTERGWVGQDFDNFYLVQVYCKKGGNICVYMPY